MATQAATILFFFFFVGKKITDFLGGKKEEKRGEEFSVRTNIITQALHWKQPIFKGGFRKKGLK